VSIVPKPSSAAALNQTRGFYEQAGQVGKKHEGNFEFGV